MTASAAPVGLLLFTYFAFVGASSPYLSLYFDSQGFSAAAIGVLMTLPQVIRIVAPPVWGWLADRSADRSGLLRGSALAALAGCAALGLAGPREALACGVLVVLHVSLAAQGPISEAATVATARGDAGRYGRIRVWGSVGFIAAVTAMGPLLDAFGAESLPWWLCGMAAALAVVGGRLPAAVRPRTAEASDAGRVRERLREPAVIAFLVSAALMIFAHAALYAYFSLYLSLHGYSKTAIGLLWAIGVAVEIALFWLQRPLFLRFQALTLLSFSLLVAALRFGLVGATEGWLPVIVFTQLLHAVTFGVHHSACMAMMHRWFGPARQARAQALFTTVAYGLGGTAGGLAASWFWTEVSPSAAFIAAGVAALAGWVAIAVCRRLDYAARRRGSSWESGS